MTARPAWGRARQGALPLVVGHRGASAHELENTLAAFRRARADGADGVELDVQRALTGEVVVFHDDDLARLAGRPGAIPAMPFAELREVRLGGGHYIPTLSDAIEELGPTLLVNIELKAPHVLPGLRLVGPVAALVRKHGLGGRALVSSFHPAVLAAFRAFAPEIPTGYLFYADQALPLRRGWPAKVLRPLAMHPEHILATAPRVATWHARGLAVNVWTVDDEHELRRLAAVGVDGIITNDPSRARRALV